MTCGNAKKTCQFPKAYKLKAIKRGKGAKEAEASVEVAEAAELLGLLFDCQHDRRCPAFSCLPKPRKMRGLSILQNVSD
jgi:hypothetical protein